MLKVLLKLQLRQLIASYFVRNSKKGAVKQRSRGMTVLLILVFAYCGIVFMALSFGTFLQIGEALVGTENGWVFFAFLSLLVFLVDFLFTIFSAKSQLFEAKDNEVLLALPVRPRDILLSRMLVLLFSDYLFEGIIALPALLAWILLGLATPLGVICAVIGFLAMPCLALTCSCLVGWLFSLLTSRMKNPAVFTTILGIGFMALYLFGYMKLTSGIEWTPEMMAKLSDSLGGVLFYPFFCYGRAAAEGDLLFLLLYLLMMLVPFALLVFILSKTFLSLVTKQRGGVKAVYRATVVKAGSQRRALLRNEFRRIVSSAAYMLNGGMGLLFMAGIAVGVFFLPVDNFLASGISPDMVVLVAIAAVSYLSMMSLFSASSISFEGQNIYLLQSLPLSGRTVLLTKLSAHLILTAPMTLVASVACIIALPCSPVMGILLLLIPQIFNLFNALLGLLMNLALPRFDWTDEVAVAKQSGAVGFTMLISMVGGLMVMIPAGILAAVTGSAPLGAVVSALIPLGCSIGFYLHISRNGDRLFQALG